MAKRRKLEAPTVDDLTKLEEELSEVRAVKPAPIAQIAGQAAVALDPRASEDREASATLARAEEAGLLIREIPLDEINADALVRDRIVVDAGELDELQKSISKNGLRLPIEVYEQDEGRPYGLLSGYRRLMAVQQLLDATELPQFAVIKAVVRDPAAMGGAFAAMVEENEVRAQLSHFERGRIAVIAAQQGAFENTEAAVEGLFPVASKAKRSKIRSFALIFEELGDLLTFPDLLREKDGLRIAGALRDGHDGALRDHLERRRPETPDEELGVLVEALDSVGPREEAAARRAGGRPKKPVARRSKGELRLEAQRSGEDVMIRIRGAQLDDALVDNLLAEIGTFLTPLGSDKGN